MTVRVASRGHQSLLVRPWGPSEMFYAVGLAVRDFDLSPRNFREIEISVRENDFSASFESAPITNK